MEEVFTKISGLWIHPLAEVDVCLDAIRQMNEILDNVNTIYSLDEPLNRGDMHVKSYADASDCP